MEIPNYPTRDDAPVPVAQAKPVKKDKEPDVVKPVAHAKIKKSKLQEFASAFFEEDIDDVKSYIFKEVFVRGVKDIIFEAFRAFWYPGGKGGPRGGGGARKYHTSYEGYYENAVPVRSLQKATRRTSSFDIQSIAFDSRREAQDVLDEMIDQLLKYEKVTVARLYDFSGLTPPVNANKYGWYSLNGAETVTLEDGLYGLRMPEPKPIA